MFYTLDKFLDSARLILRDRRLAQQMRVNRQQVRDVLSRSNAPDTEPSQDNYIELASDYSGPGEYGYGARANWIRGTDRAKRIVEGVPSLAEGQDVLEVGCGDGMTAVSLSSFGLQVRLTDLKDWRDPRAQSLQFDEFDLSDELASLPGGPYDLIFSFNAFEHFPNPASVLKRMLAKVKPGGHLFFEFGPLYCGPWGLHAYRMLPMPYPQFLFGEDFWRSKLRSTGVKDLGQDLEELQPLNRWTVSQFDSLWNESGCAVLHKKNYIVEEHIDLVIRYPTAFQGRGLTYEDLTTQGICVLLQKKL